MSVNIRRHPRGGWDVDITVLLATGDRHRERRKLSASYSKTTAREWGERGPSGVFSASLRKTWV